MCLVERLLDIDFLLNKRIKEERNTFHSIRAKSTILIKGIDKGSAVYLWDREHYFPELTKQLDHN